MRCCGLSLEDGNRPAREYPGISSISCGLALLMNQITFVHARSATPTGKQNGPRSTAAIVPASINAPWEYVTRMPVI